MKLFIQILFFIFCFTKIIIAGESGDLPGQEINKDDTEIFSETPKKTETLDISNVKETLEPKDLTTELPKNRIQEIFGQYFLAKIDGKKINVLAECEKTLEDGNCFIVEPEKSSKHFNSYYVYTNSNKQVYSIIAFNDQKQGDLNKCKEKIISWRKFFENFDLIEKNSDDNPYQFILTDAPQQNSIEIFASCYTEKYRDINSSFSIKFYKNI